MGFRPRHVMTIIFTVKHIIEKVGLTDCCCMKSQHMFDVGSRQR